MFALKNKENFFQRCVLSVWSMHFSVRNDFVFRCFLNHAQNRDTKGEGFSRGMFYLFWFTLMFEMILLGVIEIVLMSHDTKGGGIFYGYVTALICEK